MTGMKCEWGRPPAVSYANVNGGRLAMQMVPKKNRKVNSGNLFRIFEECVDLVIFFWLKNNSRDFVHTLQFLVSILVIFPIKLHFSLR